MVFQKKIGHFGRKNGKERGQEIHKNYFNGISRKILQVKWSILGIKMIHDHNSGSTLRMAFTQSKSSTGTLKLY